MWNISKLKNDEGNVTSLIIEVPIDQVLKFAISDIVQSDFGRSDAPNDELRVDRRYTSTQQCQSSRCSTGILIGKDIAMPTHQKACDEECENPEQSKVLPRNIDMNKDVTTEIKNCYVDLAQNLMRYFSRGEGTIALAEHGERESTEVIELPLDKTRDKECDGQEHTMKLGKTKTIERANHGSDKCSRPQEDAKTSEVKLLSLRKGLNGRNRSERPKNLLLERCNASNSRREHSISTISTKSVNRFCAKSKKEITIVCETSTTDEGSTISLVGDRPKRNLSMSQPFNWIRRRPKRALSLHRRGNVVTEVESEDSPQMTPIVQSSSSSSSDIYITASICSQVICTSVVDGNSSAFDAESPIISIKSVDKRCDTDSNTLSSKHARLSSKSKYPSLVTTSASSVTSSIETDPTEPTSSKFVYRLELDDDGSTSLHSSSCSGSVRNVYTLW